MQLHSFLVECLDVVIFFYYFYFLWQQQNIDRYRRMCCINSTQVAIVATSEAATIHKTTTNISWMHLCMYEVYDDVNDENKGSFTKQQQLQQ